MILARELACELTAPVLDAERGAYYLGATTPDIRVLTQWDRARTHFFDLHDFEEQNGVQRLFEQEPALGDAAAVSAATAAFVAGYISHLVLDEDYITQIYRPLFGERSPLHADATADVLDKALQWDIDRAARGDGPLAEEIKRALIESAIEVDIDFIARETLLKWRDVSSDVIGTPPTIDRLVRFLQRRLPELQFETDAHRASFADGVPALLDRAWQHVGAERVQDYLSSAKSRARRTVKEYLS